MAALAKCVSAGCTNFGNALRGGRCNSCAAGHPVAAATFPAAAEVEEPYSEELLALVKASLPGREAALADISAYPP